VLHGRFLLSGDCILGRARLYLRRFATWAIDYADMLPMLQAIQLQGASPVVRVSWSERWMIMQTLDARTG
jgi:hypothetical protein